MKIQHKNYPHPVLSEWSDDIRDSVIACDVEFRWDRTNYYLDYKLEVKNATIEQLVATGAAHFMIHLECSRTFYRRAIRIGPSDGECNCLTGTVTIAANEIKDTTEVSVFVCATSAIEEYVPVHMHPDYAGTRFQLENGDYMAVWKTCRFELFQDYDPIRRADSIISFRRDPERKTGDIRVDTGYDKLIAWLPRDTHELYESWKSDKSKEDILVTMLALPIIIEGLLHIKETIGEGYESSGASLRWYRSIVHKLRSMGRMSQL